MASEQAELKAAHEQIEVEREDLRDNNAVLGKAMDWMDSEAEKRGHRIDWADMAIKSQTEMLEAGVWDRGEAPATQD